MSTYRYNVTFRKDTNPAFETLVPTDHPANPADIDEHANAIVDFARALVAANQPEIKLDGYSAYCITRNGRTIWRFW